MALYHFHADLIRRSKGQSAVAAAAYRSGEKLHSEYYGEDADYTRKGGVRYTEIFLPPQAPKAYLDRETLWNAVEKAENHPSAQLAYSYDIAFQYELTLEENIALARKFVMEQFVSKGMTVDFAVHDPDKECPNPHFHVLCPIRPILENGEWGEKEKRVYVLDEQGNRVRNEKGRYVFNAVSLTDWGKKETLMHWREEWANYVNRVFEEKGLDFRIDHRSNKDRGLDELPTVHEGPAVRAMEARGIRTEKGELNRRIRSLNASLREIRKKIKSIMEWIAGVREKLREPQQPDLAQLLNLYHAKRNAGAWSRAGQLSNLKRMSEIVNYLSENNIGSVEELHACADKVFREASDLNGQIKNLRASVKVIDDLFRWSDYLSEYKPLIEKMNGIRFKSRREKFKQEHEKELNLYYMARRKLKGHLDQDGNLPDSKLASWKKEKAKLAREVEQLSSQHRVLRDEQKKLTDIQVIVDNTLRQWEKEHGLVQQKDRPMER